MFSDLQAFPFDQLSLMAALRAPEAKLTIEPHVDLAMGLMTTAPPFMTKPDEIEKAHRIVAGLVADDHQTKWRFGLQHPPIEENGTAVSLHRLRRFADLGIKVMAIAYKTVNALGGGFAVTDGLSEEGEKFLVRLSEVGLGLDLSHANHKTARQCLEFSEKHDLDLAICATHGGCHSIYGHPRNLPDDVLQAITARGGIIGLVTVPWMLSEKADTLEAVRPHLDHLLSLISDEAICFGTDAIYRSLSGEEWNRLYQTLSGMLDSDGAFQARFPMQPEVLQGPGLMRTLFEWVASEYGNTVAERICCANPQNWFHSQL